MRENAHLLRESDLANLAVSLCPDCGGTEKTRDADGEWHCDCRERFERRVREDAEFPAAFDNRALGDLDWDRVLPESERAALVNYAAHLPNYLDESLGLILLGPVGSGKTHLAIGMAKLAVAHGNNALFVNAPAWFQSLRESYSISDERRGSHRESRRGTERAERDWMREMKNAQILVLDDLGAEKPSDWMRERLYLVVNHRVLTCAVTFVTANSPLEQLEHAIGERVTSRLYGSALVFLLTGSDYRRVEREARLGRVKQRVSAPTA